MIEAVLFDMDGILIDSEREYDKAMREAITRYGHIITDEFLLRVRGIPVEAFKKSLKLSSEEIFLLRNSEMILSP